MAMQSRDFAIYLYQVVASHQRELEPHEVLWASQRSDKPRQLAMVPRSEPLSREASHIALPQIWVTNSLQ